MSFLTTGECSTYRFQLYGFGVDGGAPLSWVKMIQQALICGNRFEPLDDESFRTLQKSLISYIQSEYLYGSAESTAPCAFPDMFNSHRKLKCDIEQSCATSSRTH